MSKSITALIRDRVETIRENEKKPPIDIIDHILQSEREKKWFIEHGPFLGVHIDNHGLMNALESYQRELSRVAGIEEGIFRTMGAQNGYILSENEYTCWGVYFDKLSSDGRSREDLDRIKDECNVIVQQFLPQPALNADKRGLVIGQVQSGKTTIFNGVISAAADMGFNLIIVLSGTLESLRMQTQQRIKRDVTDPWQTKNNPPFYFTWISNHNGPGLAVPGKANSTLPELNNQSRRQVAIGVFLKNASVLKKLRAFLTTINPADYSNIRGLVIDDEADQATPNAGVNNDTITAINREIKSLIISDSRYPFCPIQGKTSYLGFTATPFANLLNEAGQQTLYPKDFLYFLRPSGRYFGPWQIFGNPDETEEEETIIPLDVIRTLAEDDIVQTVPQKGKPYNPIVSPGLEQAIRWFALASAARRVHTPDAWSTMLIHTSSRTLDHVAMFTTVSEYCRQLQADWTRHRPKWRELWEAETQRVGLGNLDDAFPDYGRPRPSDYPAWKEVAAQMDQVIKDIKIRVDNSLNIGLDRIFYSDESPASEKLQIAIGGNTLSRGLTLEGLVSSYFARNFTSQSGYDTLLQMGRWFGFRQGYELLTRLWTTEFLKQGFRDLVIMELNLRKTLQLYLQGQSPANKAPIIKKMPAMAITRKSVMGNTVVVEADYSGAAPQTILFHNEASWLQNNLRLTSAMLNKIEGYALPRGKDSTKAIYNNVPADHILELLGNFFFWEHSNTFNGRHMLDFIEKNKDAYGLWSVVVMGGNSEKTFGSPTSAVKMINRSRIKEDNEVPGKSPVFINLKSLRATRDLLCDWPEPFPEKAKETEIWELRRDKRLNPVLIIYPIDKDSTYTPPPAGGPPTNNKRTDLQAVEHIIGLSLVMNPPNRQKGAQGIQLDLADAYENDEEADSNPGLPESII